MIEKAQRLIEHLRGLLHELDEVRRVENPDVELGAPVEERLVCLDGKVIEATLHIGLGNLRHVRCQTVSDSARAGQQLAQLALPTLVRLDIGTDRQLLTAAPLSHFALLTRLDLKDVPCLFSVPRPSDQFAFAAIQHTLLGVGNRLGGDDLLARRLVEQASLGLQDQRAAPIPQLLQLHLGNLIQRREIDYASIMPQRFAKGQVPRLGQLGIDRSEALYRRAGL